MQCTPYTPVSLLPGRGTECPEWGKVGQNFAVFLLLFDLKKKKKRYYSDGKEGRVDEKEKKKEGRGLTS